MAGSEGADLINRSSGNDSANGGGGDDEIRGGAGNDLLAGGSGHDRVDGGEGDIGKGALETTPQVQPGADETLDTGALSDGVALKMALWADLGHGLFLPDTSGADLLLPENDWGWA